MFVGKVIGTVWSTVKWPEITGHKLLLVRPYHLRDLQNREGTAGAGSKPPKAAAADQSEIEAVVCIDLLDAGVGDDVVVAFGHAARVAAESVSSQGSAAHAASPTASPTTPPTTPIDAAVVAVVDSIHVT